MDFADTPEEARFRSEVRQWIETNSRGLTQPGDNEHGAPTDKAVLDSARVWQARKAAAGFARITWPKEVGGYGGTPIEQVIFDQEERRLNVASLSDLFSIGLSICVPTVMAYGSKDTVARFVRRAVEGEDVWCQLFSEPASGSDLAGLRTRAEQAGDTWTINGQKIWTTHAQVADYGLLLTRTDPNAVKHKGLTMFYVSMKSPGVEVRQIKQANGESGFNEVFLTDVKIPDSQRLGDVGQGWQAALTTLMHERMSVSDGQKLGPDVEELLALARTIELEDGPAIKNTAVRDRLADWYVRSAGLKYTTYRTMTALSRGQQPGPEASILKIVLSPKLQDLTAFALELEGEAGVLTGDVAPAHGMFQRGWMFAPGLRIGGGTDEILRNIIAERVLGLPQDVRVDKSVPFNMLPTGR